nr:trimethyllysine dioxygenase [Quercus suber]
MVDVGVGIGGRFVDGILDVFAGIIERSYDLVEQKRHGRCEAGDKLGPQAPQHWYSRDRVDCGKKWKEMSYGGYRKTDGTTDRRRRMRINRCSSVEENNSVIYTVFPDVPSTIPPTRHQVPTSCSINQLSCADLVDRVLWPRSRCTPLSARVPCLPRQRCISSTSRKPYATVEPFIEVEESSPTHLDAGLHGRSAENPAAFLRLYDERKAARVEFANGRLYVLDRSEDLVPVSGRWLRDICPCPVCTNPDTSQRNVNVLRLGAQAEVTEIKPSHQSSGRAWAITWRDGHSSVIAESLLTHRASELVAHQRHGYLKPSCWDSSIAQSPPIVSNGKHPEKEQMARLMQKLTESGFCFLDDVPATPEATQEILEKIGPIRNTHYGGFYDFTADLSSKDTAYTNEHLDPHTDNTYFTEPAGLQALHMLSHTDGSGGESSLVDGFEAAKQLKEEDYDAYCLLSETGVYAHASGNEGVNIQPAMPFPTFSHHPEMGYLMQVRWNSADRAGVAVDPGHLDRWYDAASKFDAILSKRENQYWFQLKPGRLLSMSHITGLLLMQEY